MKLLSVDTIEEARAKILESAQLWQLKTENVPLDAIQGRILAEDLYASCDIPGFSRATVDGYAVLAADTAGAGESIPVFLKKAGSVIMGSAANFPIRSGECASVPTGAMLPIGADAVVMTEYCEINGAAIAVYEALAPGSGLAEAGEDCKAGDLLLRKGTVIRPQEIGALAAAGIFNPKVYSPLKFGIISTGDEIIPVDQIPRPGEIRDINTHALKALAQQKGYHVIDTRVLPDEETVLETFVKEAIAVSDIVLISGGSSQGEKDYTAAIIDRLAKPGLITHGLAIRPGKPTIIGRDDASKTLLVGLPGHPVSAMMVFEILFGWLSQQLFTITPPLPYLAKLSCNVPGSPGKTVILPVILSLEEGIYSAQPVFGKSGMITTLTRANGYIIIDMNKEGMSKGDTVMVYLF